MCVCVRREGEIEMCFVRERRQPRLLLLLLLLRSSFLGRGALGLVSLGFALSLILGNRPLPLLFFRLIWLGVILQHQERVGCIWIFFFNLEVLRKKGISIFKFVEKKSSYNNNENTRKEKNTDHVPNTSN